MRDGEKDDLDDLAAFWPDLSKMPDGVDIFRELYGEPTGEDTDDERETAPQDCAVDGERLGG